MLRAVSGRSDANLFFVNNDGTIRWQIQPPVIPGDPNKKIGYIVSIKIDEEKNLKAYSFLGIIYKLDIKNGNILDYEFEQ